MRRFHWALNLMLIYWVITLSSCYAFAQNSGSCRKYLSQEIEFYQMDSPIHYQKVEVFRRNNFMGPQQYGKLSFEKWAEYVFYIRGEEVSSIVGLTEKGVLYHLIKFPHRALARRLNGDLTFTDFKMTRDGQIFGLSDRGQTYYYSAKLWGEKNGQKILKQSALIWAGLAPAAIGLKNTILNLLNSPDPSVFMNWPVQVAFSDIFVATVTGLSVAFGSVSRYDYQNTFPNGFRPIKLGFNDPKLIEYAESLESRKSNIEELSPPDLSKLKIPDPLPSELTEDIR